MMSSKVEPSKITVCFYRGGAWSLSSLAVRADTRRPGQTFSDVPSHCAIVIGGALYEVIASGWHCRLAVPSDYEWCVIMHGLNAAVAVEACNSYKPVRYGWWVDALIALARFIPNRWLAGTRGAHKNICSAFLKFVLEKCGWDCPHWLRVQFAPESPNDIWYALRPPVSYIDLGAK